MNGDGHSPTWPLIARWLVGIAGFLLVTVSSFLTHQVVVVIPEITARHERALIEQETRLVAMRDFELTSLKYEMRRLTDALEKLDDRLRQQEMTNHGRN
jgi:hypothetical protein